MFVEVLIHLIDYLEAAVCSDVDRIRQVDIIFCVDVLEVLFLSSSLLDQNQK